MKTSKNIACLKRKFRKRFCEAQMHSHKKPQIRKVLHTQSECYKCAWEDSVFSSDSEQGAM